MFPISRGMEASHLLAGTLDHWDPSSRGGRRIFESVKTGSRSRSLSSSDARLKGTMSAGRILVVDDEPQIRRVLRTTLAAEGYEVEDARSGEIALEVVRARRFDLILLDMNLPGL